jgi:endo-1,4-beta-xylanase
MGLHRSHYRIAAITCGLALGFTMVTACQALSPGNVVVDTINAADPAPANPVSHDPDKPSPDKTVPDKASPGQASPTANNRATPIANDATEQRIRRIRMGDLTVNVVDGDGKPVANAAIDVTQVQHGFPFGLALNSEMFDPQAADINPTDRDRYMQLTTELFNAAVPENALKWMMNEHQQGIVSYGEADRMVTWAQKNRLSMRGHTIFWEDEKWNQDWVKALKPKELRQAMTTRAEDVCRRYRGKIDEFDVFNEALHGDFYRQRLGDGIFAELFKTCQKANPNVKLYVNDYGILESTKAGEYVKQIRDWQAKGAVVAGIGVQAHLEVQDRPSVAAMERSLDQLAQLKLPIKLTEVSIEADSDAAQAEKMTEFLRMGFSHPAVEGIIFWGFWEGNQWLKRAALYRQDWSIKPAGEVYRDLVYRQWWSQEKLTSDAQGRAQTRVFYGRYTLTVRHSDWQTGDRQTVQTFVIDPLPRSGKTVTVKLAK